MVEGAGRRISVLAESGDGGDMVLAAATSSATGSIAIAVGVAHGAEWVYAVLSL
jgi:hypothetical protein